MDKVKFEVVVSLSLLPGSIFLTKDIWPDPFNPNTVWGLAVYQVLLGKVPWH
jgi:hypothetical protein